MPGEFRRRDFLKTVGAAGAALAVSPKVLLGDDARKGKPVKRPNIVYLMTDEHRYQSMSFTEAGEVKTPNMAAMARSGVSFDYAISNNPVCVPHRCILLSGKWSHRTGAVENQGGLGPWDRTLGHAFGEAGYVTGYTGKWHAGGYPAQAGFDWHMLWGNTNDHWDSYWTDIHGENKRHECKSYQPITMTNQALDFLDRYASGEKPFFLMVSWNPPHYVFQDAPEEKKALYPDADALPWRKNAADGTKEKWWLNYQGYHAHVTAIDEEIGRVFRKLDELGVRDNTIVIYTSDHGSMMNSHGKGNKRHPEEESCRVPFLVTGPSVPQNKVRKELFGTIDIFPTLCAVAGIDIPDFCDGQDFSANVYGRRGACDPESQLLMHVARAAASRRLKGAPVTPGWVKTSSDAAFFRGVRGKRYTYGVDCDGEWVLWDNEADPFQMKNLINDAAYTDVRKKMGEELDAWLAKAEEPFLNEKYLAMSLPESILQQAVDGAVRLPLHHVVMRLKLTPEQFAKLPDIRAQFYDERGHPVMEGAGNRWERAAQQTAVEVRKILDAKQQGAFDRMMERQAELVG